MEIPDSMDELVYFTNRGIAGGHVTAWARRQECPQCHGALMGKPKDKKGSIKIRASEYVCPECGHTVEKQAYEESLTAEIVYTCPHCAKKGDAAVPFKRKKVAGVDVLRFPCGFCSTPIDITKKMKEKKEKK